MPSHSIGCYSLHLPYTSTTYDELYLLTITGYIPAMLFRNSHVNKATVFFARMVLRSDYSPCLVIPAQTVATVVIPVTSRMLLLIKKSKY